MKTFRRLLDYEIKKLIPSIGGLLLLTVILTVAMRFTLSQSQENFFYAGVAIWMLVVFGSMPFLAASTFANEQEGDAGNLWDFIPVTRNQRYIVKWSALGIAILCFIILEAPAAMGLRAITDIRPQLLVRAIVVLRGDNILFLLIPLDFVISGVCAGTLSRKTIAGGLIGGGIGLLLMIVNFKGWITASQALGGFRYYTQCSPDQIIQTFWGASGFALPIGLLWSHYLYFRLHDETRSRWFAAGIFLPRLVILFAVFFGALLL